MICPKCQNPMRTVDRLGIHIDQCDGCRGIFLDRGELEQIVGAEQRYTTAAAPPPYQGAPAPHVPPAQHYPPAAQHYGHRDSPPGYRDSPPGYGHAGQAGYGGHGGHYKKKRKSFLEELFD